MKEYLNTKDRASPHSVSNTKKNAENTMRNGVFLTSFEAFGNVVKHGLECLITFFQWKLKLRIKRENKIVNNFC